MASLGLAILLVTVFNPGFNASYTAFRQRFDTPTAFAVVFCGLIMQWHGALKRRPARDQSRLESSLPLAATKPDAAAGEALCAASALLAAGFLVTALKARFLGKASGALVLALVPALLLRWAWQDYTLRRCPAAVSAFCRSPSSDGPCCRRRFLPQARRSLKNGVSFSLMGCAGAAGIRLFRL